VSHLAGTNLQEMMQATLNPLVGISIGLVLTATLQSSSAVTSILVALVASSAMTLQQAVPIVIGSNMGTTFTAFLVALSHINSKREFRKGMAAALLHVFFNIGAAMVLYPLELAGGLLSDLSSASSKGVQAVFNGRLDWLGIGIKSLVSPVSSRLVANATGSWLWVLIGLGILFGCILLFRTVLKILWMGDYARKLNDTVFAHPWQALGWGAGLTAFIHSSTVTTSLAVPLSAQGAVVVRKLVPFIIGANIGTTLTALIASIGRSEAGLSLAFSHLLFNLLFGALVFFVPIVQMTLLQAARKVAGVFAQKRSIALLFLVLFYFALPLLAIFVSVR
jgi:sodium-dependent phosphate cotransporter